MDRDTNHEFDRPDRWDQPDEPQRRPLSLLWPLFILSAAGPLTLALVISAVQSYQQMSLLSRLKLQHLHGVLAALKNDPVVVEHLNRNSQASGLDREAVPAADPAVIRHMAGLADALQVRLTLLDAAGRVLVDTAEAPVGALWQDEPDVYLARTLGRGEVRRIVDGTDITTVTMAVGAEMERTGYLRISSATFASPERGAPVAAVGVTIGSLWFWAIVLGYTAIVMPIALQSARRIRRPLLSLTSALSELGELTWKRSIDVSGRGEMRELGEAFNRAVDTLETEFERLKERSHELEQSARFLETVLGAMIEGVIVVDARHNVVFANSAAGLLFASRIQPRDMPGRQLLEIARHRAVEQAVQEVLAGKSRVRTEFELAWVQRTISLFVTHLRTEPGALLVLHDITELRRLEKLRREFVSNVSHELKTPLAAVAAYVETLLNGAMNDPNACQRFLQGISEQTERLNQLILDLLRLARIESGNEAFDIREVALAEAIHACVAENQPVADAKGVTVQTDPWPTELYVRVDVNGLRTIIDNLLTNAVKYTSSGGNVRIHWSADDHQVRIDVADTGIGIAREHLPRIFERFYRVDEGRSRDVGGTGLGLAIVKHLCQVFGGRITVDSEIGKGSTFTVYLPRA